MAQPAPVKAYLFFYNLLQFVGWSYVMAKSAGQLALHGNSKDLWSSLTPFLWILQVAQVLEVVHCFTRLVPSSPFQAIVQLLGRFFNLFAILTLVPQARLSVGFPLLLIAWTVSETSRYIYYAINIYSYVPYFITYLRYSLFIFANPLGLAGEVLILLAAVPGLKKKSYLQPQKIGFLADFIDFLPYALTPIFLAAFINMYVYMFSQRKKVLAATSGRASAKATRKAQ